MKKIIFIIVLFATQLFAQNLYVDNEAIGANNGTSWTDAWESFADIDWGELDPGETLFLSGGTDSTIYTETLNVNQLYGTADNLITIRNGLDAGHNGKVVIDKERAITQYGIHIVSSSYLRFVGFTLYNVFAYQRGTIQVNISWGGSDWIRTNVIYIDSMNIIENESFGILVDGARKDNPNGYDPTALDSVFIRWNYIYTTKGEDNGFYETDGIGVYGCSNAFVIGNTSIIDCPVLGAHNDPMYAWQIQNLWVEGNKFVNGVVGDNTWNDNEHAGHALHMYDFWSGTYVVFNNLVYNRDSGGQYYNTTFMQEGSGYQLPGDTDTALTVGYFYNNTTIGNYGIWGNVFNVDTAYVKNNIFYMHRPLEQSRYTWVSPFGINLPSAWDYNLYYAPSTDGDIVNIDDAYQRYSMAELNALGMETGGTPSERNLVLPLFINIDNNATGTRGDGCGVSVGSPCIDAGVDIVPITVMGRTLEVNTDINGTARPIGEVTIGAFQYVP